MKTGKLPVLLDLSTLIIFSLFSYFVIGDNFKAQLGMIDDHQIINILGPKLKIDFIDLPRLFCENVFGSFGTAIRQVPTYFALRTLEVFFWRDNAFFWYLTRFVFLVCSLFITWLTLNRRLNKISSLIFVLFILTAHYWSDILTRLGTHEIYVLPGLALYAFSFMSILYSQSKNILKNWFFLLLGTIISVGSKENLVVILLPALVLYAHQLLRRRVNKIASVFFLLSILFGLYVVCGTLIVLKNMGHDVYANDVSLFYRIKLFAHGLIFGFVNLKYKYFIVANLVILIIAKLKAGPEQFLVLFKLNLKYYLLGTTLIVFYSTQFTFYNGQWPTEIRYDFPGMLSIPFFLLSVYTYSLSAIKTLNPQARLDTVLYVSFFSYLLFFSLSTQYKILRQSALENQNNTVNFKNKINKIIGVTKNNPKIPIIFNSHAPFDYEPIASVNIFLTNYGAKNNKYLKLHYAPISAKNELEKQLTNMLVNISNNGGTGEFSFKPLSQFDEKTNCVDISYVEISNSLCQYKEVFPIR